VGPTGGVDVVEKRKMLQLHGFEPRTSSQSLYRLSYPGSSIKKQKCLFFKLIVSGIGLVIFLHKEAYIYIFIYGLIVSFMDMASLKVAQLHAVLRGHRATFFVLPQHEVHPV
jgi:hypothetical protein